MQDRQRLLKAAAVVATGRLAAAGDRTGGVRTAAVAMVARQATTAPLGSAAPAKILQVCRPLWTQRQVTGHSLRVMMASFSLCNAATRVAVVGAYVSAHGEALVQLQRQSAEERI